MSFHELMTLVGAMVVIISAILLLYAFGKWYSKRMGIDIKNKGQYIKVVDRASIGQNMSIAVVETAGEHFLLGISDKNIQLISKLENFKEVSEVAAEQKGFSDILKDFIVKPLSPERTSRGEQI